LLMLKVCLKNWFWIGLQCWLKNHTRELNNCVFEETTAFDCPLTTYLNLLLSKANLDTCPVVLVSKIWVPVTVSDSATCKTYMCKEDSDGSTASFNICLIQWFKWHLVFQAYIRIFYFH
jgi:hypothetical protein